MKYKKYISILVVAVFLCTLYSAAAQPEFERNKGKEIEDTGTINIEKIEDKEVYYIQGDNGTTILGKHFDRYVPLNLKEFGEEFLKEGLHVKFSGHLAFKRMTFPILLRCYRYKALPIILTTISQFGNDIPVAEFKWEPAKPKVNEEIQFTDLSKDDEGLVSWEWDFGDGETSKEQNPVHVYSVPKLYTVTLTVKDEKEGEDSVEHTVLVSKDGDDYDPKISIVYGVVTDFRGRPVKDAKVAIVKGRENLRPINSTETDERGHYALGVKEPGDYTIGAYKLGIGRASEEIKIPDNAISIEVDLELRPFWM